MASLNPNRFKLLDIDSDSDSSRSESPVEEVVKPVLKSAEPTKFNQRFVIDNPNVKQEEIEDIFSVKKNNIAQLPEKPTEAFRGISTKKEVPEFIWVKQYTKVYDVNDPNTTFPIFSHYKNQGSGQQSNKKSPALKSMPLIGPSDISSMNLSSTPAPAPAPVAQ
jgi:hypothetical protein